MEQLPKSVRDQLGRSQGSSSDHLDADQMTAFAESALTSAERDRILEHLAHCSECREVLFLSHPETAAPQTVLTPSSPRRIRWMAWAGFGVAVIAVSALFLVRREPSANKNVPTMIASETKPQQQELAPAAPPPPRTELRDSKKVAPQVSVPAQIPQDKRAAGSLKMDQPPEPILEASAPRREQDEPSRSDAYIAKDAVAEKQGETIIATAASRPVTQGPANSSMNNISNVAANEAAPSAAPMAKASRKAESDQRQVANGQFAYGTLAKLKSNVVRPTWRIAESGSLEKSYDSKTWVPALPGNVTRFHVVSVVGGVVWAGGEQGALFVSNNDGGSWVRVHLGTSETVSSIQFTDQLKGVLKTDVGSTWRTTDGGTTWNRQ